MNQTPSRKRPAPGTSPTNTNPQQSSNPNFGVADPSQLSNDQFLSWGGDTNYSSNQVAQPFSLTQGASVANSFNQYQPANQLVRRNLNQQLTTRSGYQGGHDPWGDQDISIGPALDMPEEDDAELEAKAAAAKRDALSKRVPKQIPPFIQKLSSFLERDYTDLIRWSEDGNSFIVVDEDKFAQKLIPELFKHNNYASFVRQLNMYGFHKVVGLSDNSMRASEKKAKTPREYKHPYFKRARPDLLWLIEKPKSATTTSKKKQSKTDQHDNADDEADEAGDGQADEAKPDQQNKDLAALPKADLASFTNLRKEVEALQKSQQQIYSILARMRDENNQYIRQASAMVANHERHESSINAILTFLATFYNQTLQDREATGNMFAHAIPHNQPQGSVFDVGDYPESAYNQAGQFQPLPRRPLALLPPPTASDSPSTEPSPGPSRPRTRSTTQKPLDFNQQSYIRPSSAGGSGSQTQSQNQPRTRTSPRLAKDNDEILNVINRSNAQTPQNTTQGPKLDFNSALQHYQNSNGKGPLSQEERDAMLNIMANNSGTAITDSQSNPQPYLDYFNSNQEQLEMLHRLQQQQDSKVQELAGRIQPLSPSGSIPGLDLSPASAAQQYNPNAPYPDNFDINNFIDNDIFDPSNTNLDPDFDWGNLDGDLTDPQVKTEPSETPRNEQTNNDNDNDNDNDNENGSLFGDGDGDGDGDEDADDDNDNDNDNDTNEADGDEGASPEFKGRVVGSVDTSSGRPSPSVEDAEDDTANTASTARSPRKKRRTGK